MSESRAKRAPLISVVIPVGPGHDAYAGTALASVTAQTLPAALVEAVVVDDTRGQRGGAGAARNAGLAAATAPLILWLDADDYLAPDALSALLVGYAHYDAAYVYGDWWDEWRDGSVTYRLARPYSQRETLSGGLHLVTCLMATADARDVGGWGDWPGWEDWEFWSRCASQGLCGAHIAYPTLVYRHALGALRERSTARKEELKALHRAQFKHYYEEPIMGCGCGNTAAKTAARRAVYALGLGNNEEAPMPDGKVRMEFVGSSRGPVSWRSPRTKEVYRGADNAVNKFANAHPDDVEWLESLGVWRRVPRMPAAQPVPPSPPTSVEWASMEDADSAAAQGDPVAAAGDEAPRSRRKRTAEVRE